MLEGGNRPQGRKKFIWKISSLYFSPRGPKHRFSKKYDFECEFSRCLPGFPLSKWTYNIFKSKNVKIMNFQGWEPGIGKLKKFAGDKNYFSEILKLNF